MAEKKSKAETFIFVSCFELFFFLCQQMKRSFFNFAENNKAQRKKLHDDWSVLEMVEFESLLLIT